MSHDDTNTSTHAQKTLSDVKKERRQCEQDVTLLSNRIKLLQLEEEKTWKQIEEAKKKKTILEMAQKRSEEKNKLRNELQKSFERQRELKQKRIQDLKFEISKNKQYSLKSVEHVKKQAYVDIRNMREQNMQQKYQMLDEITKKNKERSSSVKVEHIKQSIKIKKLKELKEAQAKNDYIKRINDELNTKSKLENRVSEMEQMELELIKRLQNTQNLQQKVVFDLQNMKKKSANRL
ncbi:hypothetical protein SteCoe_21667 [Stentor coeruleus]|uniref:Uncharacterized protein n=1 Tax=Stentor coeruleus TaxID=5963 RepID=A0A1R2BP01_9CILI|nr:hypothetical protein SteCoe_21667 [Stentor coeruleus]